MSKDNSFKTLTDREHILLRPAMYIGATDLTASDEYIMDNGTIELRNISFVPGLIKIINELIDNSVDVAIKSDFKSSNRISVKITSESVTVQDNGTGIPVRKEGGAYIPQLAWGQSRAGSNFSDDANRTQIGMNGVGSYATNCFSSVFIGKTDDGNKSYTVTFTDNASSFTEKLQASKKPGTEVTFYPDLKRFGITEIDDVHVKVIEQRLINLSMSFPSIQFSLNGKKLQASTFKKFAEMFGEDPVILETDNYRYAILYNEEDDFRHFSYVNGLKIPEGGTHIESVVEPVVRDIRTRLIRKYKDIKPADVRNKLLVIAFLKDLPNTKFNSQSKEKITNSRGEIMQYLGDIDLEALSTRVFRNKKIIDGITEVYRIKEEFKKRQELKQLKKPQRIKSDKYIPAIKTKKYLFITEGQSAAGSVMPTFGREEIGYYMLKGKPLNVITSNHQRFMSNVELSELFQIIQNEGYEKIVMATDADLDAVAIQGLTLGFIWKMLPEYKDSVYRLRTPVIVITKNGSPIRWTYNLSGGINPGRGEVSNYMKGLGSWDSDELRIITKKDGFDNMVQKIEYDDDKIMLEWLDKDSTPRKKYILANTFDIADV